MHIHLPGVALRDLSTAVLTAISINLLMVANTAHWAIADEPRVVTIGTGAVSGLYYPIGSTLCRLLNRAQKYHAIRCLANSTDGSVYNLNAIRSGELDMGIVQSDWQYHAYRGSSAFQSQGPNEGLRALFSLHDEPFTVVARKDSGIRTFDDLKGKRVNIGNPGSGQRATMDVLMAAKGWRKDDFAMAAELKPADQSQAMCDNEIDAIVYIVGHPNRSILEATTACDSILIPVTGPEVEILVKDKPYYIHTTIPGGMYRGNPSSVETFGVKATLVTSTRTAEDVAYWVVKSVFDNLEEFRSLNRALANLTPQRMISDGNSIPFHAGAERYFREAGLLKER